MPSTLTRGCTPSTDGAPRTSSLGRFQGPAPIPPRTRFLARLPASSPLVVLRAENRERTGRERDPASPLGRDPAGHGRASVLSPGGGCRRAEGPFAAVSPAS